MIKLVKLKDYHKDFLFNLRNKNYVINNSLSKKKISKIEHNEWFKKILNNKIKLKIIKYNDKIVGMIRIEKKKNFSIISWAITRNFQNLGIGTNVLKKTTKYKGAYRCYILQNNIASLIIALKAGFILKKISNQKVNLEKTI